MTDKMFQYDFDQLARYENGRTPVLLTEEQYRRARACVNACAGISTDAIEQEGSAVMGWQRTARKLIDVTKQRDELLDALETVNESAVCFAKNEYSISADAISKVENAIASSKGSAS